MESIHPLAPHHLPSFVTEPGHSDWLFVAMGIFVVLAVVAIGVFYFKLHALPEHMAHRGQKLQFEIVAVLALIALFTHNHAFWIAALLLALVPLPDFSTPLASMAHSLSRMAGRNGRAEKSDKMQPEMPGEPIPTADLSATGSDHVPADAPPVEQKRA